MKTTQETYENLTQSLIGDTIRKVVYHTDGDGINVLTNSCNTPFHILDKALLFQMESGVLCMFFCGMEFEQQGLDFMIDPCLHRLQSSPHTELSNVSSHTNWSSFIGQQITGIHCHWQEPYHLGIPLLYPKVIQLQLDNQQIIYLCSSDHANQEELMVIFDEPTAHQHLAGHITKQSFHRPIPHYAERMAV